MSDIDVIFCRALLKQATVLVKERFPEIKLTSAWVWTDGRRHWEFHGPEGKIEWYGRAANAYEARYKGWMAWLQSKGVDCAEDAA